MPHWIPHTRESFRVETDYSLRYEKKNGCDSNDNIFRIFSISPTKPNQAVFTQETGVKLEMLSLLYHQHYIT